MVSEELQKVRARLRKAEDFEIKYDLLQKQFKGYEGEMIAKDRLIKELQEEVQELTIFTA